MSKTCPKPRSSGHAPAATEHAAATNTLAYLDALQPSELQSQWRDLFGRKVPARLGPELMKRGIAYRLQEKNHWGLSRIAQLRLKSALTNAGKLGAKAAASSSAVKSGTRFVREWNGKTHEVLASSDGNFEYCGKVYRSLSVIAREITGAHQSGPRFFWP